MWTNKLLSKQEIFLDSLKVRQKKLMPVSVSQVYMKDLE